MNVGVTKYRVLQHRRDEIFGCQKIGGNEIYGVEIERWWNIRLLERRRDET